MRRYIIENIERVFVWFQSAIYTIKNVPSVLVELHLNYDRMLGIIHDNTSLLVAASLRFVTGTPSWASPAHARNRELELPVTDPAEDSAGTAGSAVRNSIQEVRLPAKLESGFVDDSVLGRVSQIAHEAPLVALLCDNLCHHR